MFFLEFAKQVFDIFLFVNEVRIAEDGMPVEGIGFIEMRNDIFRLYNSNNIIQASLVHRQS
ncbi:hypothetical protein D3C87_2062140 [compost metagenome]